MLAHVNPASEVHTSIQVLPCALDELYLGDIDGSTTRAATVKVYVVLAAMNVISTFGLEKAWVHDTRVVLAADECHFHF